MKLIDRVMAAYAKVHKLTDEQAVFVRKELSRFIEQLRSAKMSENPTARPSDQMRAERLDSDNACDLVPLVPRSDT